MIVLLQQSQTWTDVDLPQGQVHNVMYPVDLYHSSILAAAALMQCYESAALWKYQAQLTIALF